MNGILSGCTGASVVDGTAVRACAPQLLPRTGNEMQGSVTFQYTSNDTANSLGPVPNPAVAEVEIADSSPSPVPGSFVSSVDASLPSKTPIPE